MSEDPPDTDAERLLRLSEEVTRIAGSIAQLSMGLRAPLQQHYPATNSNEPDVCPEAVSWLIRARRNRARYLPPDLFAEPAWDILLDLLHTELTHRRVSVSSVCIASGVPPSTGLRWLKSLEQQGLVVRKFDERDARRIFVELSAETSRALRRYFVDIVEQRRAALMNDEAACSCFGSDPPATQSEGARSTPAVSGGQYLRKAVSANADAGAAAFAAKKESPAR